MTWSFCEDWEGGMAWDILKMVEPRPPGVREQLLGAFVLEKLTE
jgi:hypothetical protein